MSASLIRKGVENSAVGAAITAQRGIATWAIKEALVIMYF
jgi:hypothetical protein